MTRIVVIATIVLAACDVGTIYKTSDGGGGDTSSGVCEELSLTPPQGHHNPGQSCIAAACHLAGQTGTDAPAYSYAGTLFKDTAGTMPYAGATIFVKLGGVEKKTITADNGNFWFVPGVAGLEPPTAAMQGETRASGCPTVSVPMVGKLVQGGGNCNNCHRTPGGTTLPIYLQ